MLLNGERFAWQLPLADIPALWLAGGLAAAGALYLLLVPLIHWTLRESSDNYRGILALVLLAGLAMRLVMIPAVPALEDDYYRYLWDGAVSAHGLNPYAVAPGMVRSQAAPAALRALGGQGALILDRVNHPDLKTVYPPVAQAAFALAYAIEPWSLKAWRLVCLLGELVTAALILVLLGFAGRSPLWLSLYWLNPLVVKELANSAHMEAIVMPFVLAAVTLLVLRRPLFAVISLGFAIGAKLWPVMLLPLALRSLLGRPWRLAAAFLILALLAAAWIMPPLLGGLGPNSGFVAFATRWQTNSALFQSLQAATAWLLAGLEPVAELPGLIVRGAMAAAVMVSALWLARSEADDAQAVVRRSAIVVTLLFLLSPAQFPWYAGWVLVFAPFYPLAGILGLTVFLPFYYVSFHLFAIDAYDRYNAWLIGFEWLAIAALFLWDAWREWRRPLDIDLAPGNIDWNRN